MSEHISVTEAAGKIIDKSVTKEDVARVYVSAELPRIGGNKAVLQEMSGKGLARTVEALSYAYRANGVFHTVYDQAFDWQKIKLPINAINLTGIKPRINEIIFSDEIDRDPVKFAKYLSEYFAAHPDSDPEGLDEFRPSDDAPLPPHLATLITVERGGAINMLDGTHRLMKRAMLGKKAVEVFAGIPNGLEPRNMAGDTLFLTMRRQFEETDDEAVRSAIIQTTLHIARGSTDGYEAIKAYWIDHSHNPDVRDTAQHMLDRLS